MPEQLGDRLALVIADLDQHLPAGPQEPGRLGGDDAIGDQPIWPAIERQLRIELLHLSGERLDDARDDIGRIGDDEIERRFPRRHRPEPVTARKIEPPGNAMPLGILPRHDQRLGINIGRQGRSVGPVGKDRNGNAARAGAQVEQPPARRQGGERQIDQQFGVRTRLERRRIEAEGQPIEFALANDTGHRFTGHTALHQFGKAQRVGLIDRPLFVGGERQAIHPQNMAGKQFGVERRGLEAEPAQNVAPAAPQGPDADRLAQLIASMAASCAAWFSVINASISSSSASPEMTLSSL